MKTSISKIKKIVSDIEYELIPDEVIAPKDAKKIVKNWVSKNIGVGRLATINPVKQAVECIIVFNQADLAQMLDQQE